MQERISAISGGEGRPFPDVVVQFDANLGTVGIGIEGTDGRSLVDTLYAEHATEIGRILRERLKADRSLDVHDGYQNANAQHVLDAELGRIALDAVTGSTGDYAGYWTWFERPQTNRLIRLLRKARDITFGKDE